VHLARHATVNAVATYTAALLLCVQASRDYCIGQQPHPAAAAVAEAALGTPLAGTAAGAAGGAVQFNPAADIVASDLVLVMDKYTAADVLREVRHGLLQTATC
jgi:hypothetical protein